MEKKAADLGIKEIYGKGWEAQYNRIIRYIPGGHHTKKLEENISNKEIDSKKTVEVFKGHFPHGASVRSLSHFGQILRADKFQEFDFHDDEKNLANYGQTSPPEIDVTKIS